MTGIGFALVVAALVLYWHICRPWQHSVNLDHYLQSKIASASPHDANRPNGLALMPAGRQTFEGVRFNVAGITQLANRNDAAQPSNLYPGSVEAIPVNRTFGQLHLLHGAAHSAAALLEELTPFATNFVPVLEAALKDSDPDVREDALSALNKLKR